MNILVMGAATVLVAGVAFGTGYSMGNSAGKKEIQQKWDHQVAKQAEQYAKDQEAARQKEQEMQAAADKLRQEKDREIRNITARANALANSVQQRPDRATANGGSTQASGSGSGGQGCDGARLPREDAIFLAGEAARANQLRAALAQCYAQYEAVRK